MYAAMTGSTLYDDDILLWAEQQLQLFGGWAPPEAG